MPCYSDVVGYHDTACGDGDDRQPGSEQTGGSPSYCAFMPRWPCVDSFVEDLTYGSCRFALALPVVIMTRSCGLATPAIVVPHSLDPRGTSRIPHLCALERAWQERTAGFSARTPE